MQNRNDVIKAGKYRLEALSEYRNEIYGISIFWVIMFHIKDWIDF